MLTEPAAQVQMLATALANYEVTMDSPDRQEAFGAEEEVRAYLGSMRPVDAATFAGAHCLAEAVCPELYIVRSRRLPEVGIVVHNKALQLDDLMPDFTDVCRDLPDITIDSHGEIHVLDASPEPEDEEVSYIVFKIGIHPFVVHVSAACGLVQAHHYFAGAAGNTLLGTSWAQMGKEIGETLARRAHALGVRKLFLGGQFVSFRHSDVDIMTADDFRSTVAMHGKMHELYPFLHSLSNIL